MRELWDRLTGAEEAERSQEILRDKFPAERGLSPETMDAVAAGEAEIIDDDAEAQALKELGETW